MIFLSKSAQNYEESDGVNGFDFWWQQHNLRRQKPKNNWNKYKIRSKIGKFSIHMLPIDPHA